MVVSNEPGYYEEGEFGIRIENLLVVKEAETPFRFGEQPYLAFERLTMCPLQRKMIDLDVRCCSLSLLCSLPVWSGILFWAVDFITVFLFLTKLSTPHLCSWVYLLMATWLCSLFFISQIVSAEMGLLTSSTFQQDLWCSCEGLFMSGEQARSMQSWLIAALSVQVMSATEIEWVNEYHKEVWDKVSPRLSGDVLEWLQTNTAPLQVPTPQVAAQA